jgi:hypothetical protein
MNKFASIPDTSKTAVRVSLGASRYQIVHGEAALKDLLKMRVQPAIVGPNHAKDVARLGEALLDII